jgi:pre-mRNA-processing factor SLU7
MQRPAGKSAREMEELRKMGLAPLEVDVVTGNSISPHIPVTISKAPWWFGASGPTLEHQRMTGRPDDRSLSTNTDTAVLAGKASRYHAGACQNCGSRTHQTQACLLPKKKVGAVHTQTVDGVDIVTTQANLTFEEKRNREATRADDAEDLWRKHEATPASDGTDQARKKIRREDLSMQLSASSSGASVRDIGELPKYLENLETGQFYDPQTRSMRGNPHAPGVISLSGFQGDNAKYETVDAHMFVEQQLHFLKGDSKTVVDFAFDAAQFQRRNASVSGAAALPSVAEENQGPALSDAMLLGEASTNAAGAPPPAAARSLAHGEHRYVFGSYFDVASWTWGYKCCRVTERQAQCLQAERRGDE